MEKVLVFSRAASFADALIVAEMSPIHRRLYARNLKSGKSATIPATLPKISDHSWELQRGICVRNTTVGFFVNREIDAHAIRRILYDALTRGALYLAGKSNMS